MNMLALIRPDLLDLRLRDNHPGYDSQWRSSPPGHTATRAVRLVGACSSWNQTQRFDGKLLLLRVQLRHSVGTCCRQP